jgi:hypothetical protein
MVDALRRAHAMLARDGLLVDLHPTAVPASLHVGAVRTGHVDAGDAPLRHAAAAAALEKVVADRWFEVERSVEIIFDTCADTIDELRDYIVENWRDARISDEVMARTRHVLQRAVPAERPRVREIVRITTLRPRA